MNNKGYDPFAYLESIDASIARMKEQWECFCEALKNGCFSPQDITQALNCDFLKTFNDQFKMSDSIEGMTKTLGMIGNKYKIMRGAKINNDEYLSNIKYSRLLPNKDYIKENNRFSPKDVEWLYLAIDNNDLNAKECCKKECRAENGDKFAIVSFTIPNDYNKCKIYDLTVGVEFDYDMLKKDIKNSFEKKLKQIKLITNIKKFSKDFSSKEKLIKFSLLTYSKIISENIFEPVETEKSEKYAPFHCLAQYFISKGYSGIIYSSTVYKGGKNIVLFDDNYATPIGDIDKFIV